MEQLTQIYIISSIVLFIYFAIRWSSKSATDAVIKTILIVFVIVGLIIELKHFNLLH